jgi:molecular chaperone GrpE (heat shock protein)
MKSNDIILQLKENQLTNIANRCKMYAIEFIDLQQQIEAENHSIDEYIKNLNSEIDSLQMAYYRPLIRICEVLDDIRQQEWPSQDFKHYFVSRLQDILSEEEFIQESVNIGDTFDPKRQKAVRVEKSGNHKPDIIVAVIKPGYRHHGRLIRKAEVIVSVKED